MSDKIQRYEARTIGRGNDYSLEAEDDGPLCRDVDVESMEARLALLADTILKVDQWIDTGTDDFQALLDILDEGES